MQNYATQEGNVYDNVEPGNDFAKTVPTASQDVAK